MALESENYLFHWKINGRAQFRIVISRGFAVPQHNICCLWALICTVSVKSLSELYEISICLPSLVAVQSLSSSSMALLLN